MPLSEEELRMLEQMERALVAEDPKLASTLRGTAMQRAARRRAIASGVVFVAGMALLTCGVIFTQTVLGIAGFLVMLAAAAVAVTALRNPGASAPHRRDTRHTGFGVVDGGRAGKSSRFSRTRRTKSSGSFMERMDERWRRRRDSGPY
ncbi:DUF3040 domain-containing protein [Nocardioides sp. Soil805]|uniref:DUF3040 domain-containing protein n=1 Tax=Nocardioides sp. Soil805 TaxID=1736416 RepID=UPI0007038C77|nr:DUF3040 domain-containing protein [Nocardioides sp. Soil805]KRF37744.1 hypothetical protein ASG94_01815 [Nocardioides sp. Soil805]